MQILSTRERTRQILVLVSSSLSILILLGYGLYNLISSLISLQPGSYANLGAGVLALAAMAACSTLILPALVHSIRRLKGQEIRPRSLPAIKFWQALLVFLAWVGCVVIAGVLNSLADWGWALALPFFLGGALLPVALLAWQAIGGLTGNSPRRLWAVFGLSLAGGTLPAMLLEYLVIGVIVLIVGVVALANPQVEAFTQQVMDLLQSGESMEVMLMELAPYLTSPFLYAGLLLLGAGIGPMIEEAVKPLALWFLGKDLRSPAEGFALGALCGAGFALVEGVLAASGAIEMLGIGLAARFTSTLMHITASGLVGWGIASIRLEKRYWRGLGAYLLACTLHGLWNGSVITVVYGSLRVSLSPTGNVDVISGVTVVVGLGLLAMTFFAILVLLPVLNWSLRRGLPAPVNDIIAPLASQPERTSNGVDSQSN